MKWRMILIWKYLRNNNLVPNVKCTGEKNQKRMGQINNLLNYKLTQPTLKLKEVGLEKHNLMERLITKKTNLRMSILQKSLKRRLLSSLYQIMRYQTQRKRLLRKHLKTQMPSPLLITRDSDVDFFGKNYQILKHYFLFYG
jgi:hypothetical protein